MTVDAIIFDLGGCQSQELHLVSSAGLAPLPLPESISRFHNSMDEGNSEFAKDLMRKAFAPANAAINKPDEDASPNVADDARNGSTIRSQFVDEPASRVVVPSAKPQTVETKPHTVETKTIEPIVTNLGNLANATEIPERPVETIVRFTELVSSPVEVPAKTIDSKEPREGAVVQKAPTEPINQTSTISTPRAVTSSVIRHVAEPKIAESAVAIPAEHANVAELPTRQIEIFARPFAAVKAGDEVVVMQTVTAHAPQAVAVHVPQTAPASVPPAEAAPVLQAEVAPAPQAMAVDVSQTVVAPVPPVEVAPVLQAEVAPAPQAVAVNVPQTVVASVPPAEVAPLPQAVVASAPQAVAVNVPQTAVAPVPPAEVAPVPQAVIAPASQAVVAHAPQTAAPSVVQQVSEIRTAESAVTIPSESTAVAEVASRPVRVTFEPAVALLSESARVVEIPARIDENSVKIVDIPARPIEVSARSAVAVETGEETVIVQTTTVPPPQTVVASVSQTAAPSVAPQVSVIKTTEPVVSIPSESAAVAEVASGQARVTLESVVAMPSESARVSEIPARVDENSVRIVDIPARPIEVSARSAVVVESGDEDEIVIVQTATAPAPQTQSPSVTPQVSELKTVVPDVTIPSEFTSVDEVSDRPTSVTFEHIVTIPSQSTVASGIPVRQEDVVRIVETPATLVDVSGRPTAAIATDDEIVISRTVAAPGSEPEFTKPVVSIPSESAKVAEFPASISGISVMANELPTGIKENISAKSVEIQANTAAIAVEDTGKIVAPQATEVPAPQLPTAPVPSHPAVINVVENVALPASPMDVTEHSFGSAEVIPMPEKIPVAQTIAAPIESANGTRLKMPLPVADSQSPEVVNFAKPTKERLTGAVHGEDPAIAQYVAASIVQPNTHINTLATTETSGIEASSARTATIAETANQLAESIVGKLAVTPGFVPGEGEVRITFKPTILDGSEVRVFAKDGTLTVSVAPMTHESAQMASASLHSLETALAAHAPSFHHVTVVLATLKKDKNDETI